MSLPVKLGLAAIGTAAASTSVYYGLGLNKSKEGATPSWSPLNKDTNFSYDGKYAKKYSRYLVGVVDNKSDAWWTWSFINRYQKKTDKDSGDGFVDNTISDGTKLKEACKSVYGGGESPTNKKVSVSAADSTTKNYKEEYVWLFCSPLGEKPQTISDLNETTYDDANANKKAKDKKQELISVAEGKNNDFWELRNKEFYGLDGFEKITIGSEDTYFSEEQKKQGNDKKPIREICKIAYEQSSTGGSGGNDPTPDQIVKYCSVDLKGLTV